MQTRKSKRFRQRRDRSRVQYITVRSLVRRGGPLMFPIHRRDFLQTTAAVGTLSLFGQLPPVRAADAAPDPNLVRLNADIEPLVRAIEETPRNRLLEEIAGRIRGGLTYKELLAALLLAGVRNIQPRPNVGFKFHA